MEQIVEKSRRWISGRPLLYTQKARRKQQASRISECLLRDITQILQCLTGIFWRFRQTISIKCGWRRLMWMENVCTSEINSKINFRRKEERICFIYQNTENRILHRIYL